MKKQNIEELAAAVVAGKKVKIFPVAIRGHGDYDGVGLEWKSDYSDIEGTNKRAVHDILDVKVTVFRNDETRRISYFVEIEAYRGVGYNKIFSLSDTAEEAFAIKDILDKVLFSFKKSPQLNAVDVAV